MVAGAAEGGEGCLELSWRECGEPRVCMDEMKTLSGREGAMELVPDRFAFEEDQLQDTHGYEESMGGGVGGSGDKPTGSTGIIRPFLQTGQVSMG